jgi:hypothetical protein
VWLLRQPRHSTTTCRPRSRTSQRHPELCLCVHPNPSDRVLGSSVLEIVCIGKCYHVYISMKGIPCSVTTRRPFAAVERQSAVYFRCRDRLRCPKAQAKCSNRLSNASRRDDCVVQRGRHFRRAWQTAGPRRAPCRRTPRSPRSRHTGCGPERRAREQNVNRGCRKGG